MLKGLKNTEQNNTRQDKSPRRINHKATKSKTNIGTTALERISLKYKFRKIVGNS